jgi:hypothetical protein
MDGDLIGKRFGYLEVLSYVCLLAESRQNLYLCRCDCGVEKMIVGSSLRAKRVKSCGCYAKKFLFNTQKATTHGKSGSPTYKIWAGMKRRCSKNASGKSKRLYFDKGIKVCDRWQSFENFLLDMGERPDGMTIERIDGNKDYEPSNCKWATPKEQGNNTTLNHIVEYNNKRQTIAQWADELGIKANTLSYRLKRAFTSELHNQRQIINS